MTERPSGVVELSSVVTAPPLSSVQRTLARLQSVFRYLIIYVGGHSGNPERREPFARRLALRLRTRPRQSAGTPRPHSARAARMIGRDGAVWIASWPNDAGPGSRGPSSTAAEESRFADA